MLVAQIRDPLNRIFCSCAIKDDDPLNDDGTFSCYPRNIGGSFLLYGKKRSHFPYQCYVGPDWPIVVIVYFLVIVIDAIVLYIISPLGWPPVLIGVIGAILLLWKYSSVACSDPGIIYKNDIGGYQTQLLLTIDPENQNVEGLTNAVTNTVHQHQPNSMECGQCQIVRPNSARHCTYCSTCIDDLDHHCPWLVNLTIRILEVIDFVLFVGAENALEIVQLMNFMSSCSYFVFKYIF